MPWWEGKDVVKRYLEEVNADGKVRVPPLDC